MDGARRCHLSFGGIGFTVSVFVAGFALGERTLTDAAIIGFLDSQLGASCDGAVRTVSKTLGPSVTAT